MDTDPPRLMTLQSGYTSAYADDTAAFFTNREEATAGVQGIYAHFACFGMV